MCWQEQNCEIKEVEAAIQECLGTIAKNGVFTQCSGVKFDIQDKLLFDPEWRMSNDKS